MTENTIPHWRPATMADVQPIAALSNALLHPYHEDAEVFADRLRLSPEGCHVLDANGVVGGYLVSHPWLRGQPPVLGAILGVLPDGVDCWYLHDVAVAPEHRGGAVRTIVDRIAEIARARGLDVMALVAVSGADGYWSRLGFEPAMTPALAAKLASYGDDSVYMERRLSDARETG